jgi:hypothetical protein
MSCPPGGVPLLGSESRRGIVSGNEPPAGQPGGHALSVERVIDAPLGMIFDAFIALYDSQRPH